MEIFGGWNEWRRRSFHMLSFHMLNFEYAECNSLQRAIFQIAVIFVRDNAG